MPISFPPTQLATRSANTSGQTAWAANLGAGIPAGALCVAQLDIAGGSGYPTSAVDDHGNTWTIVQHASRNVLNWTATAFFYYVAAPGQTTLTVSFASSNEVFGNVSYVTGADPVPKDSDGNAQTFGTSLTVTTSNPANLTANDEISFVTFSTATAGAAASLPAGYTSLSAPSDGVRGFSATFLARLLTGGSGAPESATATYSASRQVAAGILTFKPAAGAGAQTVSPSGVASGEAAGTPAVTPGAVSVAPSGAASGEAVGTARLDLNVAPSGVASGGAVGQPAVTPGAVTVAPAGVASGEAVGQPLIGAGVSGVGGVPSGEAVGTPTITVGAVTVSPSGVPSGEAIGLATLGGGTPSAAAKQMPTLMAG